MKYTIIILSLLFTTSLAAQDREAIKEERLESRKIAYITNELDLSPTEAQGFWPVYNAYQKEQKADREQSRIELKKDMTEVEAQQYLDQLIRIEENRLAKKKQYAQDLKEILPATKVARLIMLEREFKDRVLKSIKKKMKRKFKGERGR